MLTTSVITAVMRRTMSSFHGTDNKTHEAICLKNAPLKGAFFLMTLAENEHSEVRSVSGIIPEAKRSGILIKRRRKY